MAASNEVLRFDPADGSEQAWFYQPGHFVFVAGVTTDGQPLIEVDGLATDQGLVNDDLTGLWLARGPNDVTHVSPTAGFGRSFTDQHGIWLANDAGLYLFTPAAKLKLIAHIDRQFLSGGDNFAGACR
jgi:hypothetical protein